MTRVTRWAIPALVALVPLGWGLSALAQRAGEQPAADVNRAKEMTELIEQGQLNLRDAAAVAERHVKGPALEVMCSIEAGGIEPSDQPKSGAPGEGDPEQVAGKRLVYEVCCFADEKIQAVRVDGLTRKVVDVKERKSLGLGTD